MDVLVLDVVDSIMEKLLNHCRSILMIDFDHSNLLDTLSISLLEIVGRWITYLP